MEDQDKNAPAMSAEQQADLRRLQLAAAEPNNELQALEDAEAAQADAAQAAQADQNSAAVRMGLDIAIPFLSKLYPSLAEVYTDDARAAVAMTVGPVLTKYNINLGDLGTNYREEIALIAVCGPIAVATYQGIKADILEREKHMPKEVGKEGPKPVPKAPEVVTLG